MTARERPSEAALGLFGALLGVLEDADVSGDLSAPSKKIYVGLDQERELLDAYKALRRFAAEQRTEPGGAEHGRAEASSPVEVSGGDAAQVTLPDASNTSCPSTSEPPPVEALGAARETIQNWIDRGQTDGNTFLWSGLETHLARTIAACSERARRDEREAKDGAYEERNRLVAALAELFPSSLERHPEDDKDWEDDWRWIVFVDLPTGQASWHIHDSHMPLFANVEPHQGRVWDGHTTPEKYERVAAIRARSGETDNE